MVFGHLLQFGNQRVQRRVERRHAKFVAFADPEVVFSPVPEGYNQRAVSVVSRHGSPIPRPGERPNCRVSDCTWLVRLPSAQSSRSNRIRSQSGAGILTVDQMGNE